MRPQYPIHPSIHVLSRCRGYKRFHQNVPKIATSNCLSNEDARTQGSGRSKTSSWYHFSLPRFSLSLLKLYQRRSKNQVLLFPPALPFASCACNPLSTGILGPAPFICSFAPPPRSGFAIRDPAPPKLKPTGLFDADDMLRVEPCLAASRRSLTAVSWASNLREDGSAGSCYV